MRTKLKGAGTIYFTLIFSAMILLMLCLIMYARRSFQRMGLRKDLDLAAASTLSEFHARLEKEYGLYGLQLSRLEPSLAFYLGENSVHPYGSVRIHSVEVNRAETLDDPAHFKEEILFFMEERGLLLLAEELVDYLLHLQGNEESKEIAKTLVSGEKLLRIQSLYSDLITCLYGVRGDGGKNLYSIHGLLRDEPAMELVITACEKEKTDAESLSRMEKGLSRLFEVKALLSEAQKLTQALEAEWDKLCLEEEGSALAASLPFTKADLQTARECWEENESLVTLAAEGLSERLSLVSDEGEDAGAFSSR